MRVLGAMLTHSAHCDTLISCALEIFLLTYLLTYELTILVLTFRVSYVCANVGENRSRNATVRVLANGQTHTH